MSKTSTCKGQNYGCLFLSNECKEESFTKEQDDETFLSNNNQNEVIPVFRIDNFDFIMSGEERGVVRKAKKTLQSCDEIQTFADFLKCDECKKSFISSPNATRLPYSLVCGHVVCTRCFEKSTPFVCKLKHKNDVRYATTEDSVLNFPILILLKCQKNLLEKANHELVTNLYPHGESFAFSWAVFIKAVLHERCNRILQRKLLKVTQPLVVDQQGQRMFLQNITNAVERCCLDLIFGCQIVSQTTQLLWQAVRSRGCQFLGPPMQAEVLRLVVLALDDGIQLSRKVLVQFVVQKLKPLYSHVSKTCVGHVVQLLYRASCFKVKKLEGKSSLMELRDDLRSYEALRREHDSQIMILGRESGLRMSADQWSVILYGSNSQSGVMQALLDEIYCEENLDDVVRQVECLLVNVPLEKEKCDILKSRLDLVAEKLKERESLSHCLVTLEAFNNFLKISLECLSDAKVDGYGKSNSRNVRNNAGKKTDAVARSSPEVYASTAKDVRKAAHASSIVYSCYSPNKFQSDFKQYSNFHASSYHSTTPPCEILLPPACNYYGKRPPSTTPFIPHPIHALHQAWQPVYPPYTIPIMPHKNLTNSSLSPAALHCSSPNIQPMYLQPVSNFQIFPNTRNNRPI